MCVHNGGSTVGLVGFLMWEPDWRGNVKGEVCQGHTGVRAGKQKQDDSQAKAEPSGPEMLLTEKVTITNLCLSFTCPPQ